MNNNKKLNDGDYLKARKYERLFAVLFVHIGIATILWGTLKIGVALCFYGLLMYLTNEELCAKAVFQKLKDEAVERRNGNE